MDNINTLYGTVGGFANRRVACGLFVVKSPELAEKTPEEVADILAEKFDEKQIIYFGTNYRKANTHIGAEYLWIPSGYYDTKGEMLYTQFAKGSLSWQGGFVGTATEIVKQQISRAERAKSKKEMQSNLGIFLSSHQPVERSVAQDVEESSEVAPVESVQPEKIEKPRAVYITQNFYDNQTSARKAASSTTARDTVLRKPIAVDTEYDVMNIEPDEEKFYKAFYDKLLVKVGWSPAHIKSYLFTLVHRENYLLANNRGEDYIIRSTQIDGKSYAMMNTSLLNTIGNPIKIIVQFWGTNPNTPLGYSCKFWTICDSKITALTHGFKKEDINKELRPVVFYDSDPQELVFSADIDDFDLENEARFEHCIDRKVERDGVTLVDLTDNQIYASIVQAIRTAVAISKYDNTYVKPIYYRSMNQINFVIPYHISGRFDTAPELGIIISKGKYGLWQVMTVLGYEEVSCDCNCLAPYRSSSF